MNEGTPQSRAEITAGMSQTEHIAAKEVVINGGMNCEIHIVNPRSVTTNNGMKNRFIIYTDNREAVKVVHKAGMNNTVEYKTIAEYGTSPNERTTSGSAASARPPRVVEARQVVGGKVDGQVITENQTTTDFLSGIHIGGGNKRYEDLFSTGLFEQATGSGLQEYVVDQTEANRLGIQPGTYYLDGSIYTAPRKVGADTYTIVTSTVKSDTTIGYGKGNAVKIGSKFLYEKS